MAEFINPYTFVPFPDVDTGTFRREPAGHAAMGAADDGSPRLLGRVGVTVTARSPLLVRDEEQRFPRRRFDRSDSDGPGPAPYLPGSALAGVVRSLHESLAGGCLRVFDHDLLPSYRDAAQMRPAGWTLALVTQTRGDRPSELLLCDQVIRVRADALAEVLGGPHNVVTGRRVNVTGRPREAKRGLPVVTDPRDLDKGDGWVILVTDAAARDTKRPYHCAVGRLPAAGSGRLAWVDEAAWDAGWATAWGDLLNRIDDTDDMRRFRGSSDREPSRQDTGPVTAEVRFNERLVGFRHEARRRVFGGQVLWVRPDRSGVAEFALAAIWRHSGQGRAGVRVPEDLLACGNPDELCPTCRVFGSADTGGAEDERARQRAYRGHLRFSDAQPVGPVGALERHQLAPLGRPRPGSGQFYLDNDPRRHPARPGRDGPPLREWGSAADRPAWRALRGRKHYWLAGDDYGQRPLFRITEGAFTGEMAGEGEAVPAGTRFAFTVWFENLDIAELGGLLAALDPSAVLAAHAPDGGEVGFAVGGGRPFGFGTCTAEITSLDVHTAASWYQDSAPPAVTAGGALSTFSGGVDRGVRATWPALAAALHLDHVDPADVWYPPAGAIPADRGLRPDDLAAGFDFWRRSAGYALRDQTFPLVPLPDVTADDQHLPASPAPTVTGERRQPGRGRPGSTPGRRR
ncbi:MAG TPA: hypothetical protein VFX70_07280 [Mycobacteriales bacterium]|nr:hypothetical protein [Mycobacteriales bacterium]